MHIKKTYRLIDRTLNKLQTSIKKETLTHIMLEHEYRLTLLDCCKDDIERNYVKLNDCMWSDFMENEDMSKLWTSMKAQFEILCIHNTMYTRKTISGVISKLRKLYAKDAVRYDLMNLRAFDVIVFDMKEVPDEEMDYVISQIDHEPTKEYVIDLLQKEGIRRFNNVKTN